MIYVADTAIIVGDVALARNVSVWHGAVLRGDMDAIVVGEGSNVQDGAVVHTDLGQPTHVGRRVTVGHGAIVHACTVGDDSLVGMGAILSSGAVLGAGTVVAPGAVVPEGREVEGGVLVAGVPARVLRPLEEGDRIRVEGSWQIYVELARKSLPARPERAATPEARPGLDALGGA